MKRERILVVEDETIVAMDIQLGLKHLGYDVPAVVGSGEEAIQKARELQPDLILMDIQIQGSKDGIETAQEIWSALRIPIIFLTAYADETTLQRAKGPEPFGYILKPFEESELHTAIEVALRKHRAVQSEMARQEAALSASEESFRLLVESVKDYAIFMLDTEGRVSTWNKGAERITGYNANEAIGRHHSLFYPEDLKRSDLTEKSLQLAQNNSRHEEDGWRIRKDGSRFWASTVLAPIFSQSGHLKGFSEVIYDLTERKRLEDQLRAAIRARDEFLSIASHELKTPITALRLQAQITKRQLGKGDHTFFTQERLRQFADQLDSQAARLLHLVEDMLDISRIQNGKLSIETDSCDLAKLVKTVISDLSNAFKDAECQLHLDLDDGVVGEFDSHRIEQVVTNLLTNAMKFGAGKPISVTLKKKRSNAVLTIKDHGLGIAKENLERIFGRFERAVSSTHIGGLGLGLYIASEIVRNHSGFIGAESQLGEGATFTVKLPLNLQHQKEHRRISAYEF